MLRKDGDRNKLRPIDRSKEIMDVVNSFEPRTYRCASINVSEATDKYYS